MKTKLIIALAFIGTFANAQIQNFNTPVRFKSVNESNVAQKVAAIAEDGTLQWINRDSIKGQEIDTSRFLVKDSTNTITSDFSISNEYGHLTYKPEVIYVGWDEYDTIRGFKIVSKDLDNLAPKTIFNINEEGTVKLKFRNDYEIDEEEDDSDNPGYYFTEQYFNPTKSGEILTSQDSSSFIQNLDQVVSRNGNFYKPITYRGKPNVFSAINAYSSTDSKGANLYPGGLRVMDNVGSGGFGKSASITTSSISHHSENNGIISMFTNAFTSRSAIYHNTNAGTSITAISLIFRHNDTGSEKQVYVPLSNGVLTTSVNNQFADENGNIEINELPTPPETGCFNLQSNNGVTSWIPCTE